MKYKVVVERHEERVKTFEYEVDADNEEQAEDLWDANDSILFNHNRDRSFPTLFPCRKSGECR